MTTCTRHTSRLGRVIEALNSKTEFPTGRRDPACTNALATTPRVTNLPQPNPRSARALASLAFTQHPMNPSL
jgi:hypothetical protein